MTAEFIRRVLGHSNAPIGDWWKLGSPFGPGQSYIHKNWTYTVYESGRLSIINHNFGASGYFNLLCDSNGHRHQTPSQYSSRLARLQEIKYE